MATNENKWVVMKSKQAPNALEGLQNLANEAAGKNAATSSYRISLVAGGTCKNAAPVWANRKKMNHSQLLMVKNHFGLSFPHLRFGLSEKRRIKSTSGQAETKPVQTFRTSGKPKPDLMYAFRTFGWY